MMKTLFIKLLLLATVAFPAVSYGSIDWIKNKVQDLSVYNDTGKAYVRLQNGAIPNETTQGYTSNGYGIFDMTALQAKSMLTQLQLALALDKEVTLRMLGCDYYVKVEGVIVHH